jgi:hypothetical protein
MRGRKVEMKLKSIEIKINGGTSAKSVFSPVRVVSDDHYLFGIMERHIKMILEELQGKPTIKENG